MSRTISIIQIVRSHFHGLLDGELILTHTKKVQENITDVLHTCSEEEGSNPTISTMYSLRSKMCIRHLLRKSSQILAFSQLSSVGAAVLFPQSSLEHTTLLTTAVCSLCSSLVVLSWGLRMLLNTYRLMKK